MKTRMLSFILVIVLMLSASALFSCNDEQQPFPPSADEKQENATTPPTKPGKPYKPIDQEDVVFESTRSWNSSIPFATVTPDGQACESTLVWANLLYTPLWSNLGTDLSRIEISWEPEQPLAVVVFGISLPLEEIGNKRVFYLDVSDLQRQALHYAHGLKVQLFLPEGFCSESNGNNGKISITCHYGREVRTDITQLKYNFRVRQLLLADDACMAWLPTFSVLPERLQFAGEVMTIPDASWISATYGPYQEISCTLLEGLSQEQIDALKPKKSNGSSVDVYHYEGIEYYIVQSWALPHGADTPNDFAIEWERDGRWYSFSAYQSIQSTDHAKEIIHGIQYP